MKTNGERDVSAGIFFPGLIIVQPGDVPEGTKGFPRDHKFGRLEQGAIEVNIENIVGTRSDHLSQLIARLFVVSTNINTLTEQEFDVASSALRAIENTTLAEWVAGLLNTSLPLSSESDSANLFRRDLTSMDITVIPGHVQLFYASDYDYRAYKRSLTSGK